MKRLAAVIYLICLGLLCVHPEASLAQGKRAGREASAPRISGGVLDLSGFDFASKGKFQLDGYWDFLWMELAAPGEGMQNRAWHSYPVPATWGEGIAGSGTGYASYRLRVILPGKGPDLSLLMPSVDSAYALYLNGRLAFSSGEVGKDKAHSRPRYYAPVAIALPGEGGEVELLIQVSSLNYPRGGLRDSILIGRNDEFQREAKGGDFLDIFFFGGLLAIGLFFIAFFAFRRDSRELLWFALMCLLAAVKPLITGQGLAYQLGLVEWQAGTLCEYVANCLLIAFTLLYIRDSFGSIALPRLSLALAGIGILSALFCALAPLIVYTQIIYFLFVYVAASFAYCSAVCARLASARNRSAPPFALGLACVAAAGFNDILFAMRVYRSTNLIQAGLFLFLVCQAWIILRRFLSLLDMEERLARELDLDSGSGDAAGPAIQASREQGIEEKVRRSLAELREKDALLLAQSRQASMGELVADLAHQWKQPLNGLSLIFQTLDAEAEDGPVAAASARRAIRLGMEQIDAMTATIDDYRNYFREDREKAWFRIGDAIAVTARLQSPLSERLRVSMAIDCPADLSCHGFRNEFCQVMTNLIANSLDAFGSQDVRHGSQDVRHGSQDVRHGPQDDGVGGEERERRIRIGVSAEGGAILILYRDNAGGIAPAAIGRLFEPYFTTKEKGTGIGLYICKTLIERHFGGSISASSESGSAIFAIRLPLHEAFPGKQGGKAVY